LTLRAGEEVKQSPAQNAGDFASLLYENMYNCCSVSDTPWGIIWTAYGMQEKLHRQASLATEPLVTWVNTHYTKAWFSGFIFLFRSPVNSKLSGIHQK